jgi:hypothetical protein
MALRERRLQVVDWINLALYIVQLRNRVNTIMKLRFPQRLENS